MPHVHPGRAAERPQEPLRPSPLPQQATPAQSSRPQATPGRTPAGHPRSPPQPAPPQASPPAVLPRQAAGGARYTQRTVALSGAAPGLAAVDARP
jgi:hypothetical protein